MLHSALSPAGLNTAVCEPERRRRSCGTKACRHISQEAVPGGGGQWGPRGFPERGLCRHGAGAAAPLSAALGRSAHHHASPAEENHLLRRGGAELRLRAGDGSGRGDAALGDGDHPVPDGSSAGQRHWPGAGQVHRQDPVRAALRRAREAVRARGETSPVLM